MSESLQRVLLVFLGGGVGSTLRYLTQEASVKWLGTSFPAGTLVVNLVGSFLMGAVFSWAVVVPVPAHLRVALTAGALGGFTTYSSFNQEVLGFFQRGSWGLGALYVTATVMGALLAGFAGHFAAKLLPGGA